MHLGNSSSGDVVKENAYEAPVEEAPTNHSRFSADEWRYMANEFTAWLVGFAIWCACILVAQLHYTLQTFNAEKHIAGILFVSTARDLSVHIVFIAAINTLVMVTERRAKRELLQPVLFAPWWTPGILVLALLVANVVAIGLGLILTTFAVGIPWLTSWESVCRTFVPKDLMFPIIYMGALTPLLMFCTGPWMRLQFRFRGRLILKLLVAMFLMGLVKSLLVEPAFWLMSLFDDAYKVA